MMCFGDLRAEQEEILWTDPCYGKLPDDVTAPIQGGSEVDPADSRQPVGEEPLQPVGAAGAGHAVLGEVGALGEPDAFADRRAFFGDDREGVGAAERHVLARLLPRPLEPQRMLESEARAPYRVVGGEPVIDRRGMQCPAGRKLLVGEGDTEPAAVV